MAAGLTLLAYLARQLAAGREAWRQRTSRSAMILLCATLLLAALGVAVPALLWASSWVTWKLGFSLRPAAAVSSLTVITTYLGAVVALFWRNRTTIAKTAGTVTSTAGKAPVNHGPAEQHDPADPDVDQPGLPDPGRAAVLRLGRHQPAGPLRLGLVPAGALAVLAVVIDQTSLSLHPFYRRRLARAFAVRRVKPRPRRYRRALPRRRGHLAGHLRQTRAGFPAATFAATANITGQDRTPPGRAAVPFMLAHDYIGGPATGWVHTEFLRNSCPGPCRQT